ncbi:MAG TPA: T3SS effector HopA1 family protein [Candidatus Polarisedimenticolia bacterium]|jgi:hypothetical protein|nr:T3SS effector HopA1 family protein [Candidatus Polarisedimenticolia bacterium]
MKRANLNYEEELSQIVAAIEIVSPSLLMFDGQAVPIVDNAHELALGLTQNSPVVMQLQNTLYQHCYCRRFSPKTSPQPAAGQYSADPNFIAQLSQANASASRWDAGWQVRRVENNGQIWADKGGSVRMFWPGEYMNFNAPGSRLKKGDLLSIFVARESTNIQPGLYFAFSETVMPSNHLDVIRFYWNLENSGALSLMQCVTRDLNRFQVAFQFKCSVYRQGFDRRDAAVLYIHRTYHAIVRQLISAWADECSFALRNDVPLFTLPVGKGIGLAEDPGTGESFGMNRCRHVAEAIWNAQSAGVSRQSYLSELKKHFHKHGLDPARLYLNAGSVDQYSLQA